MKECSCKLLEIFFRNVTAKGLPQEVLAEGVGVELRSLQNLQERIDWDQFRRFMNNAARIWTQEELEALGAAGMATTVQFISVIGRLLFSATELYGWLFGGAKKKGAGYQMITCIEPSFKDLGANHLLLELNLASGYAHCVPYFYVAKGSFVAIPRIVGLPHATVTMELTERGARYEVHVPPGGGWLGKIRKVLLWPFTVRAAAEELKAANEALLERYQQLDQARSLLAAQAEQLQSVNLLGRELAQHTDLQSLGESVAKILTEQFHCTAVGLWLIRHPGEAPAVIKEVGQHDDTPPRSFELSPGGEPLGRIDVWGYRDPEGGQGLLEGLIPFISIALENARSFALLHEYQGSLEQKVAERTAELNKSKEQLEEWLARITEMDQQKTEFFANASHELRTPLTLMLAPLEALLARQGLPPEAGDELRGVLRGGYRLMKLINDLLDISKIEAGAMRLRMGRTDLSRLIEEVVRSWRPVLQRRGVGLELDLPPAMPLTADAERLEQVALNLLSNAVKHVPDGGHVRVAGVARPEEVEFSVENSGGGIDPVDLPRIFDRFAQSTRSRSRRFGSTGLGLPVVRELVELHGGRIQVDNLPGEKVTFRVVLPVGGGGADDEMVDVPRPSSSELLQYQVMGEREVVPAGVQVSSGDKPMLLLAEDNGDLRSFLARNLRGDFQIVEAADGRQALELVQTQQPDIVLSDLMMPEMDGMELCRALKSSSATACIPFVLLTARGELDTKVTGLSSGADDYLVKPFHMSEVRLRLMVQLRIRELSRRLAQHEKLAALGTMVAGVAHEVRNPLNGIINSLLPLKQMLAASSGDVLELLELAISSTQRVEQLSAQLLRQVRADERPHEVSLTESVSLAVRMLANKVTGGPKLVSAFPPGGDVIIMAEPTALNQVWINLLDNAIDAAGPSGEVTVAVQRFGEGGLVEVKDNGPGMAPQVLRRIFDPFFTTKDVGKGTGLGLSIVREIVQRHGGEISVQSSPGQGALFRVTLPAGSEVPAEERAHG